MTTSDRTAIGFAAAPLGAFVVVAVTLVLFSRFRGGGDLGERALGLGLLAPWVFGVAYLAEALVGGPLHFELQRRGKTSLGAYSVIGVIAGITPFFLYQLVVFLGSVGAGRIGSPRFNWQPLVPWGIIGATCGVASAAVFWWISVRPRPRE